MISKTSAKNQTGPRHKVTVLSRQQRFRILPGSVVAFCSAILNELGRPACLLTVVFVSLQAIQELNRKYRSRDYATDVLSFGYGSEMLEGNTFLGEIVIAPEVAQRQALRWNTSPERELRRLLVHGILHLLGYNHEVDDGEMNRMQSRLTRRKCFKEAPPMGRMVRGG